MITTRKVLNSAALLAITATFPVNVVQAENGAIYDNSSASAAGGCRLVGGMAVTELKSCYGEPDEVTDESTRQVWHYGECELYVSDKKLIAWLNAGELAHRHRLASLARPAEKDYDPTDKAHWENEWTPRKEVLPQEELLDLVGDE